MQTPGFGTDFSSLIISLHSVALGSVDVPEEGTPSTAHIDPSLMKYNIDILLMLREKTKGNLTKDEAHLLNTLIYELQLVYVKHIDGKNGK